MPNGIGYGLAVALAQAQYTAAYNAAIVVGVPATSLLNRAAENAANALAAAQQAEAAAVASGLA